MTAAQSLPAPRGIWPCVDCCQAPRAHPHNLSLLTSLVFPVFNSRTVHEELGLLILEPAWLLSRMFCLHTHGFSITQGGFVNWATGSTTSDSGLQAFDPLQLIILMDG